MSQKVAHFRFYEELNDFLAPLQRRTAFSYSFKGAPSIKDAVEAIGVPHTEVDLILVNSVSVGFEHRLRDGDRVSVYPTFESVDISPVVRLRPAPLRQSMFVLDTHLGKLTRLLRMLGFDALYRRDYNDADIVRISNSEKRSILTRDRGILKTKAVTHGYWIRQTKPLEQLREVVGRFDLASQIKPFARCMPCNGELCRVEKSDVMAQLPPRTAQHFHEFYRCVSCGKVYWKGSHYEKMKALIGTLVCFLALFLPGVVAIASEQIAKKPYVVVLGVAQDGGVPQAGRNDDPAWRDERRRRRVASLAVVDGRGRRWLIDCTPDFREQLHMLDTIAPSLSTPGLDGIFLTHAHMGHYTGLMHLGHEAVGASGVPVHVMPKMADYLRNNGPWSQLVRYNNITLELLEDGVPVRLDSSLTVTPVLVPHRQEYSEVVGYRVRGPRREVLFVPDIDSWDEWDEWGVRVEELIRDVDVAYLDGTFFANGEIPGRDMSTFPHPFITHSMSRFSSLPPGERTKVRFIHLNHTNPALVPGGEARATIEKNGFRVAAELERVEL